MATFEFTKSVDMNKQSIIDRTVKSIEKLPTEKVIEISDFVDFILSRYEEQMLTTGIQKLIAESQVFDFLREEEEIYTKRDLKKVFND